MLCAHGVRRGASGCSGIASHRSSRLHAIEELPPRRRDKVKDALTLGIIGDERRRRLRLVRLEPRALLTKRRGGGGGGEALL